MIIFYVKLRNCYTHVCFLICVQAFKNVSLLLCPTNFISQTQRQNIYIPNFFFSGIHIFIQEVERERGMEIEIELEKKLNLPSLLIKKIFLEG